MRPTQEELEAWADREVEKMGRLQSIAADLVAKDPQMPYITAIIMAGDQVSMEDAWADLVAGKIVYWKASARSGSYARFELAIRALDAGIIDLRRLARDLPDLWSGSDPDDTDPRYLKVWREAYALKGGTLKQTPQSRRLPRREWLTIYRGQDRGAPFGIAWSLDRDVAMKFARGAATRQWDRSGVIYVAQVRRESVLGWMPNRHEAEVVIDPESLVKPRLEAT
jgi:hypothetical protein